MRIAECRSTKRAAKDEVFEGLQMLIRRAEPGDLGAMQRIGEACVPGIPATDRDQLEVIVAQALLVLVGELAGTPSGFAVVLDETAAYDSANFRWFQNSHQRFAYVDRIGTLPQVRGSGLGSALYERVFELLAGSRPWLCCEVNERPPNPGSLKFHQELGFEIVGRTDYGAGEKAVIFLETALPRPTRPIEHPSRPNRTGQE